MQQQSIPSSLVNPSSLALTLDNINDRLLQSQAITSEEAESVSLWIAGRVEMKGSYADMPAPTEDDFRGIRLFTGEALKSRASTAHILGEEACRALLLLKSSHPAVEKALKKSWEGMFAALDREKAVRPDSGWFCCGTCTPAYWRHLSAGGLRNNRSELVAGMATLVRHRLPEGGWKRFPFYWTVSALVEVGEPAKAELKINAKRLERLAKQADIEDIYAWRRAVIAAMGLKWI